jgi:hypothetical protein
MTAAARRSCLRLMRPRRCRHPRISHADERHAAARRHHRQATVGTEAGNDADDDWRHSYRDDDDRDRTEILHDATAFPKECKAGSPDELMGKPLARLRGLG